MSEQELFNLPKEKLVIPRRCKCRTIMKNHVKVQAPDEQQPCVFLRPALDPKFYAGSCHSCKKIYTERVA